MIFFEGRAKIPKFGFGWNTQLLTRFEQSSKVKGQEHRCFLYPHSRLRSKVKECGM